ncbi:MAG: hypothetical protein LBV73_03505, partial [Paraburkholderia sp.]|nr:hypothetical protein [Paraburkholderia sp.]
AKIVDDTNTVIFKTHKVEVKSKLAHMPWEIIAWLLHGQLEVDDSSKKPKVQLMLEAYTVDKNKYKTIANDADAEVIRKKSHMKTRTDLIREMVDSYVTPSTKPCDKINRFIELRQVAESSGIERLKNAVTI